MVKTIIDPSKVDYVKIYDVQESEYVWCEGKPERTFLGITLRDETEGEFVFGGDRFFGFSLSAQEINDSIDMCIKDGRACYKPKMEIYISGKVIKTKYFKRSTEAEKWVKATLPTVTVKI